MRRIFYFQTLVVLILLNVNFLSAQWVHTNLPDSDEVSCFALNDTNLFVGTTGGVFLSTNNGTDWNSISSRVTISRVNALAVYGINLFVGTYANGIFRSSDNGTNWAAADSGLTNNCVLSFAIRNTGIYAGTVGGVFRSTDNGDNWAVDDSGLANLQVNALVVGDTNLFAATDGGVFRSNNSGTSWVDASTGMTTGICVNALLYKRGILYAGTSAGIVYYSSDQGSTWGELYSELTNLNIRSLAFTNFTILAGTEGGVYLLPATGGWIWVNSDMTDTSIQALCVNDMYLFAGTSKYGVWRRSLANLPTSASLMLNAQPKRIVLQQNFPNPFNPSTKIRYQLPTSSKVTIKVYSLLGQNIASLVNEQKQAGSYSVEWNASNVPSGVYFYRTEAVSASKRFVDVKKMILLK